MDLTLPDSLATWLSSTPTWLLALLAATVAALLAGLVAIIVHSRRTDRDDTGSAPIPEYWLQPIREEVARQLQARWDALQRDFVDAPADTLRRADALIAEAMRERGYPAVDAAGRARLLNEHEPVHAPQYDHLRLSLAEEGEDWTTEQRRQAFLHVRTLFDALLREEADEEAQATLFVA